jgi:hypothetical protein
MVRQLTLECGGLPPPLQSNVEASSDWGLKLGVPKGHLVLGVGQANNRAASSHTAS